MTGTEVPDEEELYGHPRKHDLNNKKNAASNIAAYMSMIIAATNAMNRVSSYPVPFRLRQTCQMYQKREVLTKCPPDQDKARIKAEVAAAIKEFTADY